MKLTEQINRIKEIIGVEKNKNNMIGVQITRPNQKLIIMRGIPGSGKSTLAREIVGDGVIHSTDNVIESKGNYFDFFDKMIKTNDFSMLKEVHQENLHNATNDMENGVTPVIIDNTNIKPFEPKPYILNALNLGYDDKNIEIMDVGTGGLTAEELALRNTHKVPLNKIISMIKNYINVGPLSLTNIINN